ncbi:MAG: hypothetical protein Q8R07_05555, partial [Candidatus Uhrbacteria bacterium]|nr:hypothetical protein [Candidatus Uhrbacteria bacterium]
VIVIGIGYLLYRIFFRPTVTLMPPPPSPGISGQLPAAGEGTISAGDTPTGPTGLPGAPGITQPTVSRPEAPTPTSRTSVLYSGVARAISIGPSGGLRSFHPEDGKFYRTADNGQATPLSDKTFYDVDQVRWAKKSDQAILTYPDGSKILYDFTQNKQVTLPKHWEDFDFAPQDDRIVAKSIGNNESNRFLVIANPDGTGAKVIEELGDNQDKVHASWSPNNQIVAYSFTGDPIGYDRQAIVLVGQHQENFKNLIVEGRGFVPNWAPSGNNILYSVYHSNNGYRPSLWLSGAVGDNINANRTNLDIQTWADKCAWKDESTLICAVPRFLAEGAGLQREIANSVPDDIYKIDLSTGQKVNLGAPDGNPTVGEIQTGPDVNAVYLKDQNNGKLIRFAL